MSTRNLDTSVGSEVLLREAEAERERAAFVAESKKNLGQRCPECGALGSLEEVDGVTRCIDCDMEILAASALGGLGRK